MKYSKLIFSAVSIIAFSISSCSNDDSPTGEESPNYSVAATYTFERNSTTTVDFSGQSSRLLMLEEMGNLIKTAANNGTQANKDVLINMYSNTNNAFSSAVLNTSGKQLKDKTAASKDYFELYQGGGTTTEKLNVQAFFETQLTLAEEASLGTNAAAGVSGFYLDGTSKRLFAANGLE
ncbi:MAG: hypothetical protein ACI9L6_001409, partial [Flavobacterium sp.]